jgi:ATP/maltotriose-dependent transcriptional regulator MalT
LIVNTKTPQEYAAEGQAALSAAAWSDAKAAFEKALSMVDSPDIQDGLGLALWWLNEVNAAHHHRGLAYQGFKADGAIGRAALIACWLAREQIFLNANFPAMQGWFARAERLVDSLESGLEREWYAILRASLMATPDEMVATAAQIIAAARQAENSDLEAFALAFGGQALVTLGRVGEGMSQLDEAMTMATGGEITDLMIISEIFCVLLSTCEVAGDLVRSDLWCRAATEFAQRYHSPFLSAYCRIAYGGLMTALGRWGDAEAALLEAISTFERGHKALRVHAVIKLADLRVSQGKIEEAETMLEGLEDQGSAVIPLARLCLQKGETALAKAILEQSLPTSYNLNHLPALVLLVEVLLTMNDVEAARQVTSHLVTLAEGGHSRPLLAQISFTKGRVSFEAGDFDSAKASFNAALDYLQSYEQSLLAGQIRLRMAQMLKASDKAGAVAWAKGALATFERIGAEHDMAEAAGLLRQLGITRSSAPRLQGTLTQRETEILSLVALGLSNRDIAERLVISPKTVEHHVSRILDKLNLRGRAEAAAFAVSHNLNAFRE